MSEASHSISTVSVRNSARAGSRARRRILWAVIAVVVLSGVAVGGYRALRGSGEVGEGIPTAPVIRGPMRVSITESGEIEAEEREVITNPVRWSVVIEELAPEGTIVQKGQLIIRMQCDELDDAIIDQELRVRSAEDDYRTALNKLTITESAASAKVTKAEHALKDAQDDQSKYIEAEWPQLRDEADAKIEMALAKYKLEEHKFNSMLRINADPELNRPYSKSEIDAKKLAVDELKLQLRRARTEKEILHKYTHVRKVRNNETAVREAKMNLRIAKLEAETDVRLAKAAVDTAQIRLNKERAEMKELKADHEKLTVVAEKPGLVVYETRRRPWHRPITVAVGEEIRSGQQLMIIPNMKTLQVRTRVYEAVREQVAPGQPALIRLDAKPGLVLEGRVSKVAPLPDSQNPWLSPGVKVYPTMVTFEGEAVDDGLKPGMTAEVEIVLAELEDVLSVPIAAVFADGETTYCYRLDEDGRARRVVVEVGKSSDTRTEIVSGLKEGDNVLLAPPPGERVGKPPESREVEEAPATRPAETTTGPSGGPGRDQADRPRGDRSDAVERSPRAGRSEADGQRRQRRPAGGTAR